MINALAGRFDYAGITGLLESDDVRATMRVVQATLADPGYGTDVERRVCDCGNSGTTMRLMMGALAGRPGRIVLDGDASLRNRPMERVAVPLRLMGAKITTRSGQPPVEVEGAALSGADIGIGVASAQVKSAILLAGLSASGRTTVTMPAASRDHTERMLKHFGVEVEISRSGKIVSITGGAGVSGPMAKLRACDIDVPGDISSAAFVIVAAVLAEGSTVTIRNVGLNSLRTGIVDVLYKAGADVKTEGLRTISEEDRGTLTVTASKTRSLKIGGDDIPRLIDEIPILALAAALADADESVISGASELRVKETDRIEAIVGEFRAIGLAATPTPGGLVIPGRQSITGGIVRSRGDHRIAMMGAVAGLCSRQGVTVEDVDCVETSFPGFTDLFRSLGAEIVG